jgi:hypothetical protein
MALADMNPGDALGGQYRLRPGSACSILGQRPVLDGGRLGRLLQGQRGAQVGRTLSTVFALCAHAHRLTAELALLAADPDSPAPPRSDAGLWLETARDHLRSIALDWPQRRPDTAKGPITDWLRDCPLTLVAVRPPANAGDASQALDQLRAWLESRVLAQPVTQWLQEHSQPEALARWCHAQAPRLLPARCLAAWQPLAQALTPPLRALALLDPDATRQNAQLRALAQSLARQDDFVQKPTWQGQCAETGPWTRLRHRVAQGNGMPSAWTRLSARWLELMELAAASGPDSAAPLAQGALHLGPGQALAWCEMARGLLLHWVQLDREGAVQDYRVLAPTEWNFHPQGALAQALAALQPGATLPAQALAAAYDPCVACTVETPSSLQSDAS